MNGIRNDERDKTHLLGFLPPPIFLFLRDIFPHVGHVLHPVPGAVLFNHRLPNAGPEHCIGIPASKHNLYLFLWLLEANFVNTKWCKKGWKSITKTLAHGNLYVSTLWELSYEYQHDRVSMVFNLFFAFVSYGWNSLSMEMVNITIIIWVGFLPEETYFFQVKGRNLLLPGKREKPNFFCFLLEEMGETFLLQTRLIGIYVPCTCIKYN